MTAPETAEYIQHRLEVAGLTRPLPFDRRALQRIHQLSRGVPRRVNLLCDRALLGAFASGQPTADRRTVDKAAAEVFGSAPRDRSAWPSAAAVLALGLAAGAALYASASRWFAEPAPGATVAARTGAPAPAASALAVPAGASVANEPKPTAVVPVVASPAPAVSAPALLTNVDEGWRELAKAWQVDLPAQGDPCVAVQKHGLQCFTRTLSLPVIRELGRPGIVTLDAATGAPRYALLTALTQDTATLRAGGSEQTVTLTALAARWQGAFATLWKMPPGSTGHGAPDAATLDWIASGLAKARGASAPTPHHGLDNALRAELKSFQTARGLAADGLPGPMTFMQLNRAAGIDEPRLRTGS